jgi:TPR repeat protein
MDKATGRGIGNMGDIRRPPPFRFFLQLYRREVAFRAMIDFAVLGALTIAFLEPQVLLHPFSSHSSATKPQQAAAPAANPNPAVTPPPAPPAPAPSPVTPPTSVTPPAQPPAKRAADTTPPSKPATPAPGAASPSPPTNDSSKAVANLLKLPAWAILPIGPVDTPGLHNLPIPFTNQATSAAHPATRYLTVDDRPLANLPYQLRETIKTALVARADEDEERMRTVLKDVDSPEGTPELLIGLSYLIKANSENAVLAEKSYRAALQKGQPQAPVLLGLLLTTGIKSLGDKAAEGKSLIGAVMANDRVAWLATGNGYLNGESGGLDPVKAVPWIKKAAEADEPLALLQYARLAENGIGMEKNSSLAEGALRRAAELGLTEAEEILGRWILYAYEKKLIDDPTEGVRIMEKVAAKHSVMAVNALGAHYAIAGRDSWKDQPRGAKMLQECAAYKLSPCHGNLGVLMEYGRGIERDNVGAWAHFDVGRQLGSGDFAVSHLDRIEKTMTPDQKDEARKKSKEIMEQLKPVPRPIALRRD